MNGWETFGYYVLFIILILVSLTFHETGHFVFGKIFHANVKEFSVGIGPKYFSRVNKKTNLKFSLRWIPLGAYVLFDSNKLREIYKDDKQSKDYKWIEQPIPNGLKKMDDIVWWKQTLILLGGIIFNLLLMILAWSFIAKHLSLGQIFSNAGAMIEALWLNITLQGKGDVWKEMPSFVADGNSVVVKVILLLISINFSFAVFNVLPIPPLDGYRICELSVSKLFKKKIPDKFEITVTLIGITLIVWIFISSIICDLK